MCFLLLLLLLLLLFYRKTTEGPNNKLEKSLEDFYIACDQLQLCLVKMLFFLIVKKPDRAIRDPNRSDEGLTLETSAFLPFTVANLRFQPSC